VSTFVGRASGFAIVSDGGTLLNTVQEDFEQDLEIVEQYFSLKKPDHESTSRGTGNGALSHRNAATA
jgi:hypothetical protein